MNPSLVGAGSLALGLAAGYGIAVVIYTRFRNLTAAKREEILAEARRDAEQLKVTARADVQKEKDEVQKEFRDRQREVQQFENRLQKKEDTLERRMDELQGKERAAEQRLRDLDRRQSELTAKRTELDRLVEEEKGTLHTLSGLSRDDAVKMLLEKLDRELEKEKADRVRKSTTWVKENIEQECRRLIGMALQRYAAPHTADSVVTVVDLPNDEMKGRIIGREGRNIRSFERASGVDVIVDDTPGVVVLSAFDGVRREMARRAMEKLIVDGRIHPTRIEELVEQSKREMEEHILQVGRQVLQEENIHNVHPKLVTLLGRLKYRTSYGQNVLQHCREVGALCSVMAGEMKMDANLARRAGIFHDIGKAVDQEFEGSHPVIGGELLRRFDESKEIVDAAENHHSNPDNVFPYTIIAATADAISAARPGARGESLERYVQRLAKLEEIARSFTGIESAYAIQAGREVRIIVNAKEVTDDRAVTLAREIANEIEKQLTYPGEIKVTLMRETRVTEYAR